MRRAVARVVVLSAALFLSAALILAAASATLAAATPRTVATARVASQVARVQGAFFMVGVLSTAVNVRGEYPFERIKREWTITPSDCVASTCDRLAVTRSRGTAPPLKITLKRVGTAYAGSAVFTVGLECRGRVYPTGSRVPYTITLRVTDRVQVAGIWYATAISATYDNPRRTDSTPCPLGASSDAATYQGALLPTLPS